MKCDTLMFNYKALNKEYSEFLKVKDVLGRYRIPLGSEVSNPISARQHVIVYWKQAVLYALGVFDHIIITNDNGESELRFHESQKTKETLFQEYVDIVNRVTQLQQTLVDMKKRLLFYSDMAALTDPIQKQIDDYAIWLKGVDDVMIEFGYQYDKNEIININK